MNKDNRLIWESYTGPGSMKEVAMDLEQATGGNLRSVEIVNNFTIGLMDGLKEGSLDGHIRSWEVEVERAEEVADGVKAYLLNMLARLQSSMDSVNTPEDKDKIARRFLNSQLDAIDYVLIMSSEQPNEQEGL